MTLWPFFRSVRTGSNLSSRTQSLSVSRRNLSLRIKLPSGRAARSWVALTSVIRAFRANLPALACMPSAISVLPMSSGSSSSTLQVEKTAEASSTSNFGVVKNLDPLVGRKPHWGRDLVIKVGKWPLWSKLPGKAPLLIFWNGMVEDEPWLVLRVYLFH